MLGGATGESIILIVWSLFQNFCLFLLCSKMESCSFRVVELLENLKNIGSFSRVYLTRIMIVWRERKYLAERKETVHLAVSLQPMSS